MKIKKNVKGFTLIELAIVLMIMGVIAGAVFKGYDLLESAKARSVINDFNHFKLAINMYQETYSVLAGDDPKASERFSDVSSGNGNSLIDKSESKLFWQHLHKAGYIENPSPSSKFGGKYSAINNPYENFSGHWIILGKETSDDLSDGGLLTPKQAQMIKAKADDGLYASNPSMGNVRITEGRGIPKGQCVKGSYLNLEVKTPVCIVLVAF
jgi:prepilin-type N-terminal cleavage/methylation domain-containing protein